MIETERRAHAQGEAGGGVDEAHAVRGAANGGTRPQHYLTPRVSHQGPPLVQGDQGEYAAAGGGGGPALAGQDILQRLFHLPLAGGDSLVHHVLHLPGVGAVEVA